MMDSCSFTPAGDTDHLATQETGLLAVDWKLVLQGVENVFQYACYNVGINLFP